MILSPRPGNIALMMVIAMQAQITLPETTVLYEKLSFQYVYCEIKRFAYQAHAVYGAFSKAVSQERFAVTVISLYPGPGSSTRASSEGIILAMSCQSRRGNEAASIAAIIATTSCGRTRYHTGLI